MSPTHYFGVAPERPSLGARVRWLVLRHYWWLCGRCSRDGKTIFIRVEGDE